MSEETNNIIFSRTINEKIQDLIVESIKTSNMFYIRGDEINAYRAIKQVFWHIVTKNFQNKTYLQQTTKNIDLYLQSIEQTGGKPDMKKIIEVNNKKSQLKELIEEYLEMIPFCLDEIGLGLQITKKRNDPDEVFSEQTFTTNESLLEHKKKELRTTSIEVFIKNLTPRQIHDVHSRLLTYNNKGGMKRLPYEEIKKNE